MVAPLESTRASLRHAERRLAEFAVMEKAFYASKPYQSVKVADGKGAIVHKIRLVHPVPEELAGTAFDALSSMRASLDQMCFDIAVAGGAKGKDAHFPFGDNAGEVRSRANGGAKELPKPIFDLLCSFEPHKDGQVGLWGLNKLVNSGKHEMFTQLPSVPQNWAGSIGSDDIQVMLPPAWDSAKNEAVFAISGEGAEVHYDFQLDIRIAFAKVWKVCEYPALQILAQGLDAVTHVVNQTEAEAKRLAIL